jgi:hypothetical protein
MATKSSPALAVLVAAAAFAVSPSARAEPTPTEQALAQTLFDEGRALMTDQRFAEACAKFAKSQELDPSAGTFINLALCHESQGKFATAWAEFNEALSQALRDGRSDREQSAQEHIAALKPKLNQLTVRVPDAAKLPGLSIKLDDQVYRSALWEVMTPVDPGGHRLEANAPGKKAWSTTVTFDAPGTAQSVDVPALEDAEAEPKGPPFGLTRRTAGLVVGGAGVVALAVGSYFGLRAFSKNSSSEDACRTGVCTQAGLSLSDQARSAAWASNIFVALGLIGVGVGTYLFVTSPSPSTSTARSAASFRLRLGASPVVGQREGGLALDGAF